MTTPIAISSPTNGNADGTRAMAPRFVSHRLARITNVANRGLTRLISGQFGLTLSEWRVMAAIGDKSGISANAVCRATAMDKVRVSRAVSGLLDQGYLRRDTDAADRRRSKLYLSAAGERAHDTILPLAERYDRMMLEPLSGEEERLLNALFEKLESGLADIAARGFQLPEASAEGEPSRR